MKGGKTYEEMMASRSPESQKRILEGTERLQEEYLMTRIRRDLGMSQAELVFSFVNSLMYPGFEIPLHRACAI